MQATRSTDILLRRPFVLGALLVALLILAVACTGNTSTSSTTTVNGEPAVHMGVSSFIQPNITLSKGSKLLIVDDGTYSHILNNGMWQNNTPSPATEAGAPSIQNVQMNGSSIEIGPFNTTGTFHIYCTIHPGMTLTVTVQ